MPEDAARAAPGPVVASARDADLPALRRIAADGLDRERVDPAGVADLMHFRPGVSPELRLLARLGPTVVGFCYASMADGVGAVDAFAVAPGARRRGVASALLDAADGRLAAAGCGSVRTGGHTRQYAWPGVDVGYRAARALLAARGLRRLSVAHNMDVDLAGWVPGRAGAVLRPQGARVVVRRGRAADLPAVRDLIRARFDAVWDGEMCRALRRAAPTGFVAERDARLVGFAAHGVYRPDLFGPLGVDPDERGSGIGRALLLRCLDDMAATGLAVAQISWIGPAAFYERSVGARPGRTFLVLGRPLARSAPT